MGNSETLGVAKTLSLRESIPGKQGEVHEGKPSGKGEEKRSKRSRRVSITFIRDLIQRPG